MTYDKNKIGKRIYDNRNKLGLTLEQLAELSGVSRQSISNYESGKNIPTEEVRRKLCKVFNCDMGYLMCEYNNKTRKNADVAAETGLSDKAITGLKVIQHYKKDAAVIDFLLSNYITGNTSKLLTTLYDCFQLDYHIPVTYSVDGYKLPPQSTEKELLFNYSLRSETPTPQIHLAKDNNNLNDVIPVEIDTAFLETVLMNKLKDEISDLRKDFTTDNS